MKGGLIRVADNKKRVCLSEKPQSNHTFVNVIYDHPPTWADPSVTGDEDETFGILNNEIAPLLARTCTPMGPI